MKNNKIMKALKICAEYNNRNGVTECPYFNKGCIDKLLPDCLNLMNRQKAEIERLQKEIQNLESMQEISPEAKHFVDTKADKVLSLLNEVIKSQEQIKAEAIKEFVERLKNHKRKMSSSDWGGDFWDEAVLVSDIDNLVKEMEK